MKKFVFALIIFFLLPLYAGAQNLSQKLSGRILLDVERNGEAWYVYPENNQRYYLGRPADAFAIMRQLGLGIKEIDFQRLASAGMPVDGDIELAKKLSGKIILQVEQNGEAWYINPVDLKKYYLGRPADAFKIMRELGLGINRKDLAMIHKPGTVESIDQYSKYEHKTINTKSGPFTVDLVTIDLNNPNLKIITDAEAPYPNQNSSSAPPYGATQLADFILANDAFAGINATYFDTNNAKKNYYFYPFYDSNTGQLINYNQFKYWTTGPLIVFDENNKFYYFKNTSYFPYEGFKHSPDANPIAEFEKVNGAKIQALLGNKPRLIEDKMNTLIEWDIDEKQRNVKAYRNALGWKSGNPQMPFDKGILYLAIAKDATLTDLADVMKALEVDYALNLDGGYSSALWYNGEYMVKPGRNIPNAIVFKEK